MVTRMAEAERNRSAMRGFTLIELLIVMTIIGILASIAVPNYQRSVIKAREAVLMEDLYQMRRAIDAYFADQAKYPDSLEAWSKPSIFGASPPIRSPTCRTAGNWCRRLHARMAAWPRAGSKMCSAAANSLGSTAFPTGSGDGAA